METSEEKTYQKLKNYILDSEFPVGEALSQRMLAAKTGAVVITVRSCLRRLENEGLIENIPGWGVRIPIDTPEIIKDRYFIREVIECAALKRLRENYSEEYKNLLVIAADKCDLLKINQPGSYRKFAEVHMKYHSLIAQLSGSKMLVKVLNQANLRSILLYNAKRIWEEEVDGKVNEDDKNHHKKYTEYILEEPIDKAMEAVRHHIKNGLEDELRFFDF